MALVLMHVQEFLLRAPEPSSPAGRYVLEEEYRDLRCLLVQIRCVCRQDRALELTTDWFIGRITIWMERRRTMTVQAIGRMHLTNLRGMIENFGGRLPMPGVERWFGEVEIDQDAINRAQNMIVAGFESSDEEGMEVEGTEEGLEDEGTEEGSDWEHTEGAAFWRRFLG
jgi:hypothetical protein